MHVKNQDVSPTQREFNPTNIIAKHTVKMGINPMPYTDHNLKGKKKEKNHQLNTMQSIHDFLIFLQVAF